MQPKMIVVAGPPGSGKSTAFPVSDFGLAFFKADDRAAALNGGSYAGISRQIREQVNREYEEFVIEHIGRRESFAIETTLRNPVTFEQAPTTVLRATTHIRLLTTLLRTLMARFIPTPWRTSGRS